MGETGTDFSQSNIASPAIGQESVFSGEETVGLISRLLDSKLDKKFADFKRALEQKELSTNSQIKIIWLYQLSWQCKLPTVKRFESWRFER